MSSSATDHDPTFWKREAESCKKKLRDLQEEFEEFRQGSSELEKELESHIQILERNNGDLKHTNAKLYHEAQTYKRKFEHLSLQHKQEVAELNGELIETKAAREELRNYIRELEQSNDDLGRAKRAALVSLEDFEVRLNQAIERNAFLESELDEKDHMNETVQRLKDKTKELKMELDVTNHKLVHSPAVSNIPRGTPRTHVSPSTPVSATQYSNIISPFDLLDAPSVNLVNFQNKMTPNSKAPLSAMDVENCSAPETASPLNDHQLESSNLLNKLTTLEPQHSIIPAASFLGSIPKTDNGYHANTAFVFNESSSSILSPSTFSSRIIHYDNLISSSPINGQTSSHTTPPSSRINALNVVTDLIKKVGALENKLAACRNFSNVQRRSNIPSRYMTNKDGTNMQLVCNGDFSKT